MTEWTHEISDEEMVVYLERALDRRTRLLGTPATLDAAIDQIGDDLFYFVQHGALCAKSGRYPKSTRAADLLAVSCAQALLGLIPC